MNNNVYYNNTHFMQLRSNQSSVVIFEKHYLSFKNVLFFFLPVYIMEFAPWLRRPPTISNDHSTASVVGTACTIPPPALPRPSASRSLARLSWFLGMPSLCIVDSGASPNASPDIIHIGNISRVFSYSFGVCVTLQQP